MDPKNPISSDDKDLPDPRPLSQSEGDKLNEDPAGHRPRLPDTEGENLKPDDEFDHPSTIKPTHNP